jgi:arginine exporter protein ArgO
MKKGNEIMKNVKWPLLVYAILAAVSIMGIGIAISEKSIIGAIGCFVAIIVIMGMGFKTKRKMRENGQL